MTTKYRPSQVSRGEICPGYLSRIHNIPPQPDTVWAKRGTILHSVAASLLRQRRKYASGDVIDGYTLTDNDMDSVMTYVDFVRSLPASSQQYVEKRVQAIPGILEGTADFIAYDGPTDTLTVVDYKSGYTYVPHIDNLQLCCYTLGAINTLNIQPQTVHMIVVQPECSDPIRRQIVSGSHITNVQNRVNRIIETSETNPDRFVYDRDNCRFCAVREARQCPLFQVPQLTNVDTLGDTYMRVKEQAEYLNDLLSILEVDMIERLKRGDPSQRYELRTRRTARKWTVDEKELQILGEALGIDMYKQSLISPSEAEKRGVSQGVLDTVSKHGTSIKIGKVQ